MRKARPLALLIFLLTPVCLFAQPTATPPIPPPAIVLNQSGFYADGPKQAVVTGLALKDVFYLVSVHDNAPSWQGRVDTVFFGRLGPGTASANSSVETRLADFSTFRHPGTYRVVVPNYPNSWPFTIGANRFTPLTAAALKGYYYQRSAMALTPGYAGEWSRPAGHPDTAVLVHPSAASAERRAGTAVSTPGGWYDAGDYNKYIVNSGITMGTLLDAWEDFPGYFDTLRTDIPALPMPAGARDAASRVPDLLNEALYNLRWMLTMQDPNDGGVYHKCTNAVFDGMVMPGVTKAPRYVVQKSTAATLDFAAVTAQAARIFAKFPRQFPRLADSCRRAALAAWQWARQNPAVIYDQEAMNRAFQPAVTTGAYGDRQLDDEWFWAAAELLVTTGDTACLSVVASQIGRPLSLPSWSNVAMMGDYSLLRHRAVLPRGLQPAVDSLNRQLLDMADAYVKKMPATAFHTVMGESTKDFIWGSNSVAANQGMLLINAWLSQHDRKYLDAALSNLDYILGRNALNLCFVTGVGSRSPLHPHHRPSIADGIDAPVPGLLAGGPNPGRQDHENYVYTEPETAYLDQNGAYASNEIAINWNAPLVYLAGGLEALQGYFAR
ncbi:MAG TPA: glycoside hydrolase family 9 protein [Puia sp.]|uniref:glycoside hydrolase family 9 protein n=1 Tax=Puia sp. TaxID=2045100 RepID=UPI002D0A5950|nr:glycoside hydrolase family 9 protein [Puia sp.]HVU97851.1 glycoside hydrolase family 9 protein [Puia sp.]